MDMLISLVIVMIAQYVCILNHEHKQFVFVNFFFLAAPWGLWDLSSPTRDQTPDPLLGSAES